MLPALERWRKPKLTNGQSYVRPRVRTNIFRQKQFFAWACSLVLAGTNGRKQNKTNAYTSCSSHD